MKKIVSSREIQMPLLRHIAIFATLATPFIPAIGHAQPRSPPTTVTRRVRTADSILLPDRKPQTTSPQAAPSGTSDGPQVAVIPRVVGMTSSDAIDALSWTKLTIVPLDSITTSVPAGVVLKQRPEAGTPVSRAREITLFVAVAPRKPKIRKPSVWDAIGAAIVSGLQHPSRSPEDPTRVRVETTVVVPKTPGGPSVTVPGHQVQDRTQVPDLMGRTPRMVYAALENSGLKAGEVRRDYSDDTPPGRVFWQNPPAGTDVVTGTNVAVTYSIGPHPPAPTFAIPSVLGLTLGEAADSLKRTGFLTGHVDYLTRAGADGKVLRQSPQEGEAAHHNDAVNLTITTPPTQVAVPSVTGMTRGEARQRLRSSGLGVGRLTLVVMTGTDTGIVSQKPLPKTLVDSGTLVDLVENRPPELRRVLVPDLSGKSLAATDSALQRDGLVLGDVVRRGANPADRVADQLPKPGESVFLHSPVSVALGTDTSARLAVVPSVVNLTVDSARRILTDSGFTHLSIRGGGDRLTSASIVESQNPPAGNAVAPDVAVSLVARTPPPKPTVPNLIGRRMAEARIAAEFDSLRMIVTSELRRLRLNDEVVSQDPIARSPRRPDNTVDVVVEIPAIPPIAAVILGVGAVAGAAGETVRRRRIRDRLKPRPPAVTLKPLTREPAPPVLHTDGRDTLISAAFTLRFDVASDPLKLETAGSSLVKSEESRNA